MPRVGQGVQTLARWTFTHPQPFILTGALAVLGWAFVSFDWVVGLLWFMLKTYGFVFTFVWMRGTLPRVRIDQLMGFAWKWLLPASLLNLFVTAGALVLLNR